MTDPRKKNSREARERSLPKAGSDKAKILESLKWLKRNGLTTDAKRICTCAVLDYYAVQRRMSELVKADLVKIVGKKDGYTLYEAL